MPFARKPSNVGMKMWNWELRINQRLFWVLTLLFIRLATISIAVESARLSQVLRDNRNELPWPTTIASGGEQKLKCPRDCSCTIDESHRLQTVCARGGMRQVPISEIDSRVQDLIITGPRNYLTIGPIFQSILHLQTIRITKSNVPAVGANSFYGLMKLRILDLSHNNISTIDKSDFHGPTNLQELDLSHNHIKRMASGLFYHLKNLTRLSLAHNHIDELVQRQFLMLVNLQELDLSGNPLQDLPTDVIKDVRGLRVLRVRGCRLKRLHPQLYEMLPGLVELDLGGNQFEYLERDEFRDLQRLQVLRLDGNQLTVLLDQLLFGQRSLQVLDVSRNRLVKVDQRAFERLSNLTHLDLSYNKLTTLDEETVEPLASLQVLNISGNVHLDLDALGAVFKSLSQLHTLSLADFGRLPNPQLFASSLSELRGLNLSGNHLSSIDLHVLAGLGHLKQLDLSRNQLNGITERTAARLERIADVRMEQNPLICDRCHMGAIINRIPNLMWRNFPQCFFPESLRGFTVMEVDPLGLDMCIEFVDKEDTNAASTSNDVMLQGRHNLLTFLVASVVILTALVFLIFVAWYTRHRAQYYTHEDQLDEEEKQQQKHQQQSPHQVHPAHNQNEMSTLFIADGTLISNNEISFKFPIDDLPHPICTIDEYIIPPKQPTIGKYIPQSG